MNHTLTQAMRALTFLILFIIITSGVSHSQSFTSSNLHNLSIGNPTSLQFGPDNRLYVSQQSGVIKAFSVTRVGQNNYGVTATEIISLINQIPNHNDDGTLAPSVTTRQVTGILVAGTAATPILYVTSSDSRIGGPSGDLNLDTNSGIISKLTKTASGWTKIDLVRGLPRSEENHAPNGIQLDETTNTLYLTIGGSTNAGSPSNNFAFTCEYALSAAILSVDLGVIEALPTLGSGNTAYKYDLPTVDDPTRANNPDGTDVNDPFGGNDGLNQAKIVPAGPVQVFAAGLRNAYDILITKLPGKARRMYTVDNGANGGWGGYPANEGGGAATNNYVAGEPGSTGPGAHDPQVIDRDNLHFIGNLGSYVPGTFYGGHPNPIRANPTGAGLYTNDGTTGVWRTSKTDPTNPLPADWPPLPTNLAHPIEGDAQNPWQADNALIIFGGSTNGLAEYTASNFNGAMKGDMLAANYKGSITRVRFNANGDAVLNAKVATTSGNVFAGTNLDAELASNFGSTPLDIVSQGDNEVFPGTLWVCLYGGNGIVVFEPQDFVTCSGANNGSDEDGDGYTNSDEIANGTNPCSAASKPKDNDQDFLSDLNDPDDDNDGLSDKVDYFALDAQNGLNTTLPIQYDLFNNNPGTGFFGLGFTGLMSNGSTDYLQLYDESNLIAGGAVGAFTVVDTDGGDCYQGLNSQKNGFQFGVNVSQSTGAFTVVGTLLAPLFSNQTPKDFQSQGLYIGTGDQDNYLKISVNANGGAGGIEVVSEKGGVVSSWQYAINGLPSVSLDLYLSVDPVSGKVQPRYAKDGGNVTVLGSPLVVSGSLLTAIQGSPALAVGVVSTSRGSGSPFTATWDVISVTEDVAPLAGGWQVVTPNSGSIVARHENSFVESGGKFYLLGGRGTRPVQMYDPVTKAWTTKATPPLEINHIQAISYNGLIYVINAFTGVYPHETPVPNMYIYNPATNTWSVGDSIPAARRRGSSGVVVYNNKFYIFCGIIDGHYSGWVPWTDEYDPATHTWTTLPDAPRARDHSQAALVGNTVYLAGGRRSSGITNQVFTFTVPEVDAYDLVTKKWSTLPNNIPTQRAGVSVAVLGEEVVVIGGESITQGTAHAEAEALNVNTQTWRSLTKLLQGRHGTQPIVYTNKIYIAAGSANRGGGPELNTMEVYQASANANQAPLVSNPIPNQTATVGAAYNFSFAVNTFSDPEGGTLTYSASLSNNAVLPAWLGFDAITRTFSGTPPSGGASPLSIKVTASDGQLQTSTTFSLTIQNVTTGQQVVSFTLVNADTEQDLQTLPSGAVLNLATLSTKNLNVRANTSPAKVGSVIFNLSGVQVHNVTEGGAPYTLFGDANGNYNAWVPAVGNYSLKATPYSAGGGGGTVGTALTISFTVVNQAGTNQAPVVSNTIPNQSVTEGIAYSFTFAANTFTDPNGDPLTYSASLSTNAALPAWLSFNAGSRTFSGTAPSGSISPLSIKVTASDTQLQTSTTFSLITQPTTTATALYLINCGGPALTTGSRNWSADKYFDTGNTTIKTNVGDVANTTDDALYYSERYRGAGFNYNIPVPSAGTYTVMLHFAETRYIGSQGGVGKRVFNVSLEGQPVLTNFDINAEAGPGPAALIKTFTTQVNDGKLTLAFTSVVGDAKIMAIEVYAGSGSGSGSTNQAPVVSNAIPSQSATVGTAYSFTFAANTFTDPEGSALTYSASLSTNAALPAWLSFNAGSRTFSGTAPSGSTSPLSIQVIASDGQLQISTTFSLTIQPAVTATALYLFNCGGPALTTGGRNWSADQYFDAGNPNVKTNVGDVANTTDDALYYSERYRGTSFNYNIPVPSAGTYTVKLHFAETFYVGATGGVGKRVFNVSLEGQPVLTNFDITAEAGTAPAALIKTFTTQVNDGKLTLAFTAVVGDAKISAIEVYGSGSGSGSTNQAPVVSNAIPSQSATVGTAYSFTFAANTFTDPEGSALTYSASLSTNAALPAWLSFNAGSRTFSGTAPSGSTSPLSIQVIASDGQLQISTTFSLTIQPAVTATALYLFNCGGPALTTGGRNWSADQYFDAGNPNVKTNVGDVANTTDDALYYSERYRGTSFNYNIPVPSAGTYTVKLHFAETFYVGATGGVGKRVFNVSLEGQPVLTNFDITAEAGTAPAALIKTFTTQVNDGKLTLTFTSVVGDAKISAIEVYAGNSSARIGESEADAIGHLLQAYPNPFTEKTTLEFTSLEDGKATLDISNVQGILVNTVFAGQVQAGEHRRFEVGNPTWSRGVYIVRLVTSQGVVFKKLVLQ